MAGTSLKCSGRSPSRSLGHALDSSIAQMETIDMIYEKSGLGKRFPTVEGTDNDSPHRV